MKVAIFGAGGLIGKECTRQFSREHQVLALTHRDLDVTDAQAVTQVLFDHHPALIINCAVLGVDACELEPRLAWSVNIAGAENLAKSANAVNADFLQLSTNYVFNGRLPNNSFYTHRDVPDPINVYGRTKLAGERAVSAASRRTFIVRTSWVFGAGKKNFFSIAHHSLRTAKTIRAITDVRASATYVHDLVSRIIKIVHRRQYSTYHVVNEGICSYHEFALEAGRALNLSSSELSQLIEPVKAGDLRYAALRPSYTPMRCITSDQIGLAPLRDWRVALAEYIYEDRLTWIAT